jgi:transcriptional regulator with XRE-family HTH domain
MSIPSKSDLLRDIHGEMRLKRITQQDLAEMLNLSRSTISRNLADADSASYDYLIRMLDAVTKSSELEAKVVVEYYQNGFFLMHKVERNNELAELQPGFASKITRVADRDIVLSKKHVIKAGSTYQIATQKFGGEQERPS